MALDIQSTYDFRPASRIIIESRIRHYGTRRDPEHIATHTATLHPDSARHLETLLAALDLSASIASDEPRNPGLTEAIDEARIHLLSYYFLMNED